MTGVSQNKWEGATLMHTSTIALYAHNHYLSVSWSFFCYQTYYLCNTSTHWFLLFARFLSPRYPLRSLQRVINCCYRFVLSPSPCGHTYFFNFVGFLSSPALIFTCVVLFQNSLMTILSLPIFLIFCLNMLFLLDECTFVLNRSHFHAPRLSNSLPPHIVQYSSFHSFRSSLIKYLFDHCFDPVSHCAIPYTSVWPGFS